MEEKIESVASESPEEELTFEGLDFPSFRDEATEKRLAEIRAKYKKPEAVESEAKALEWEIVKERKKPKREKSPLYKWPDKLAVKKKLTEKQKTFVDHYLKTMNATESYRASKGILDKPDLWRPGDTGNARTIKNNERVKQYLHEKILTSADELLDIQMDIIRNDKMPPAVRMDWIKDRLNRMWIGREKDESTDFTGIWEVTITIKHKTPEIVEGEVLESEDKQDGETI